MEKTTLVLGASAKPERFSYDAIRSLQKNNIPVIAIGRREQILETLKSAKEFRRNQRCTYSNSLSVSCKSERILQFYSVAEPTRIIFNPGTTNPELAGMAVKKGITVVNECMLVMLNKGLLVTIPIASSINLSSAI